MSPYTLISLQLYKCNQITEIANLTFQYFRGINVVIGTSWSLIHITQVILVLEL